MSEPNRLQIKVESESHGRRSKIGRLFTLDLIISWIRKLELDDYTVNGLIEIASRYPQAALPSFKKNINLMIQRVRAQRQKDQQGEGTYAEREESHSSEVPPSLDAAFKQAFDASPQKVGITEEDLRDEWEGDPEETDVCSVSPDPDES